MISLRKPSASARVARYAQQWRHERQISSVCASSRFSSSLASCHPSSLSSPPAVVRRHAPTILWLDWSTCCWDRISTHKNKQKGQTFQRHASTLRYGNNQHSTLAKTDGSVAKNGGSKRDIIGKSISQTNVDAFGIRSSSSGRNTNIDLEIPSLDLTKSTQLIPLPPHLMGSIPNITGNDSTTIPTSSNSMPFYNQGKKSTTVKDANETHLEEIFADNSGSKIDDIPPLDLANLSFSILHSSKLKNTSVAASGGNATNVQPTETSFDATDKSFQKDIEHAEEKLRLLLEDVNIEEFDENVKKLRMNLLNDNRDFKSLNELDLLVRKRHKIMKLQQLLKKHDILSEGDLSISTDKAFVELFEQLIHHQINASKDASKDGSVIRFKQIIIRNIRLLEEMVGIDKLIPEQRNILEEYNLTMPTRLISYENNIRNIRRNLTNQNIDPRKRFILENELRKILHKRQEELLVVSQKNDSDLVRIKNAELRLLRINDNIFDINYNLQMKELDPSKRRILENELQHLFDTRQEILGLQKNISLNLENENHNVLRINNTEDNRSSLRLMHIEENIRGVRKALANKKTDPSKRRILKGQLQRLLGKRQEILGSEQNDSPNLINENHDFLRTNNTEENVSSLRLIHIEENIRGVRKTLANKKSNPSKRRLLEKELQCLLGKRQEILGSQQNDSANLVSENHDVLRTNSTEDRIRGIRRSLRLKKLDQHQRRSLEGRLRKLLHEHNSRNRAAELLDNRDGILDSHQRSSPTLENENGSHMLDTVDHDSGLQTQQAPSSANTNLTVASYLESIVKTYLMASGGSAGSRDIGRYLSTRDSSTGNKSALLEMKDSFGNLLAFLYPRSDVFSVKNGSVDGNGVGRLVSLKGCENKKNIANDQQHSQIQVQRLNTHPYPSLANNYYSEMVEEGVTTGSGGIGRNLMPSMINIQSSSFLIPGALTLPSFRSDLITTQANGTILGHCGSTSVLSTVVVSPHIPVQPEDESKNEVVGSGVSVEQQKRKYHNILQNAIHRANARSGAVFVPLQVEFRERYHASGKIPSHNRRRRDNGGPLSDKEILAARVIDRSLRPWLMMGLGTVLSSSSSTETGSLLPENIVVNCEVQSYDHHSSIGQMDDKSQPTQQKHADPTALAINSSIAALIQSANSNTSHSARFPIPSEAAACVKLAINRDGSVIFDPTPKELAECKFELLYAGTRDRVLMLEFGSRGCVPTIETESRYNYAGKEEDPGVEESTVANALRMAHEAIIPIIEHQEELRKKNAKSKASDKDEALMTDEEVAALLGLRDINACKPQLDSADSPMSQIVLAENADKIIDQAFSHVWSKLETIALKIFGCNKDDEYRTRLSQDGASIHEGSLLPKKIRGRREHILQAEIGRIIRDEFAPDNDDLATFYRSACQGSNAEALTYHIHELVMKRAMAESAERMCRSDGRRGLNVVRPISATAPFLPDCVHGSALFSRGETQGKFHALAITFYQPYYNIKLTTHSFMCSFST